MALDIQTTTRNSVAQWFIARRFMLLFAVLGTPLLIPFHLGAIAVCEALSIDYSLVLFGFLLFVSGHYVPQMFMRLQARLRRSQRPHQQ